MSKDDDGAASASASDDAFTSTRHAKLPDDVILSCVLSRLPYEDLLRCRLVCRCWSTTIASSSSFHGYRLRYAPLEEPWLLIHHHAWWGECLAFNPNSSQWHKLCIDGVPIAAAGGFLIYSLVRPKSEPVRLAVCNPFTNTCRELPMTHTGRVGPFVGAFAVDGSAHFKVVVAGGTVIPRYGGHFWASTEVYDSLTDSWSFAQMKDGEGALHKGSSWESDSGVVCCDGIMYSLVSKHSHSLILGEHALIAYDMESGVWRMDQAYDVQRGVWDQLNWGMEGLTPYLSLVKSKRGLVLLGRLPDKGSPVCLWQLVSAAVAGRDVARWGDKREVGFVSGQGLASARTLYLSTQTGVMECKDFAYSSSPQWKMLSPYPRHLLWEQSTVSFLLEPGVIPISK